ncbi:MAG: hypothetical protein M3T96_08215 [Acidobacteriota bacterium]|nr:hypothetical protein [Acidobacteriota bacterium]
MILPSCRSIWKIRRFKNYLRETRLEEDTLNGTVLPSWENMTGDQKKAVLRTMMIFSGEKGFRKIELVNDKSEKVGIAANGEVYVVE